MQIKQKDLNKWKSNRKKSLEANQQIKIKQKKSNK